MFLRRRFEPAWMQAWSRAKALPQSSLLKMHSAVSEDGEPFNA